MFIRNVEASGKQPRFSCADTGCCRLYCCRLFAEAATDAFIAAAFFFISFHYSLIIFTLISRFRLFFTLITLGIIVLR